MYAKYMKRLLDILLSLTILIVLSPLLLVLCILVRSKLGSPIFFKQERPGLHEKIFTMYKFRTMTDKRDAEGNLLTQVSIEGMSPDSEPDPGRMADIIDFVRANNVRAIFFEELSGSRTAETVAAETGVKLLTLSPLEGLSDRQEETGGETCY